MCPIFSLCIETMRVGLILFLSLFVASNPASIMLNAVVYLPQNHAKKFRLIQPKIQVEVMKKPQNPQEKPNKVLELEKLQEKVDSVWKTLQYIQKKMIKKASKTRIIDLRLNRL